MQLNISHEVTTTKTKTVDVELPYYSKHWTGYYCILPDETVQEVSLIGDNTAYYSVYKKHDDTGSSGHGYSKPLSKAATGKPCTKEEFETALSQVLSFAL